MKYTSLVALALLFSPYLYAQNYDEAKVGTYTLPELLQTENQTKVTTRQQWEKTRRPEVLSLFEEHVYGQFPKKYERLEYVLKH